MSYCAVCRLMVWRSTKRVRGSGRQRSGVCTTGTWVKARDSPERDPVGAVGTRAAQGCTCISPVVCSVYGPVRGTSGSYDRQAK